jgi:hypothetical protein
MDFEPMSTEQLLKILGLTIKKDEINKLITFLCELSAYTENSQFNISYHAPSSTGKSYIPLEIAQLFPKEDVIETAYASPTAFFHDTAEYSKEKGGYVNDLSRKILIFVDQPHTDLLSRLRPLLSHDTKEIILKITDKNKNGSHKTKNVILIGYPSVVFCTAGLKIDEQEATRMLLLSPEVTEEKIRQAVYEKIAKDSDYGLYMQNLNLDKGRDSLKKRILAIKNEHISEVIIENTGLVKELFFTPDRRLKPRNPRDVGHIMSLIKSFALLNFWYRRRYGSVIVANDDDIRDGFELWNKISASQDLNLPPYVLDFYYEVIIPAYYEKNNESGLADFNNVGVTRQEIMAKYFQLNSSSISDWKLRREIIPMLESVGLIDQIPDPNDSRVKLIYPQNKYNQTKENLKEQELDI